MIKGKKVLKAGLGYIFGGLLIKGVSFLTTPLFTRLMTTEQFGILNSYLSFESILAVAVGFQFAASLKSSKIEFNSDSGINKYFSRILFQTLLHTVLLLLIVNIFSSFFLDLFHLDSKLILNLLVVNAFGSAAINIYNAKISIFYSYKKYLALGIANSLLNVALSLLLMFTFLSGERSLARILGYALPCISISIIICVISFFKATPFAKDNRYTRFSYSYCSPLIPHGIAEVMLGQLGRLMVDRFCGSSSMGVYSLAFNVYSIIGIIRLALDYIVGPFYFDNRKYENYSLLIKLTSTYSQLLCCISLLVVFLTPEIIKILGPEEYFDARYSAVFLVGASFFIFLISSVTQEIFFLKKTYWISIVSFFALVINALLNYIMINKIGVLGAAITTYISYLIMISCYLIIVCVVYRCKSFSVFNFVLMIALISFGCLFSFLCINDLPKRLVFAFLCLIAIFAVFTKSYNVFLKRRSQWYECDSN